MMRMIFIIFSPSRLRPAADVWHEHIHRKFTIERRIMRAGIGEPERVVFTSEKSREAAETDGRKVVVSRDLYPQLCLPPRKGSMSDQVSIASFDEFEFAERLAARLAAEGFQATAQSDAAEQFWKFYNLHPRAHCHVRVPKDDIDAALNRLKELDASEGVLKSAIRCPDCGSTRVEYPQFSRSTIIGAMPSIAAAVGLIDRNFYCSACHFTWAPTTDAVETVSAGKDMLR